MNEELDKGRSGHKVVTYRKGEPRDVAVRFIEDNSEMASNSIPAEFARQIEESEDWRVAKFCIEWWMANEVARLLPKQRDTSERLNVKQRVEATRRAFVEQKTVKEARIKAATNAAMSEIKASPEAKFHQELVARVRILSTLMPNGLRLGDCTVAQALHYCTQMGAQCAHLASFLHGRNDQDAIVRDVLTPGQLATLDPA